MREWILKKYNWKDEKNIKCISKISPYIGCRLWLGKRSDKFLQSKSFCKFFGLEIADCVDEAYENTKEFSNAHIIQADLMTTPILLQDNENILE
jgi:hypothetical protein